MIKSNFKDFINLYLNQFYPQKFVNNLLLNDQTFSFDNKLIVQTKGVYKLEKFKKIIQFINDIKFPNIQILDKCKFDYLLNNNFNNWIIQNKKIVIFKCDLNDKFQLLSCFQQLFGKGIYTHSKFLNKFNDTYNILKTAKCAYDKNTNTLGILYIDKTATDYLIAHQIIHIIEDVTGEGIVPDKKITMDKYKYFIPLEQLIDVINFQEIFNLQSKQYAKALLNKYEIIPYINTLCYLFQKNDIKNGLQIINNCIKYVNFCKNNKKTLNDVYQYISDKIFFLKENIHKPILDLLVISFVYKQNVTLIKKIIGNYFK